MRFRACVFGLIFGALLCAAPAWAQGSISFDSALVSDDTAPSPGITLTARLLGGEVAALDLFGRIASEPFTDEHGVQHDATTTSAGVRVTIPDPIWRIKPFVGIGFANVNGLLSLNDAMQLEIQPGVKVYIRPSWGLGATWPLYTLSDLPDALERDQPIVVSVFGEF